MSGLIVMLAAAQAYNRALQSYYRQTAAATAAAAAAAEGGTKPAAVADPKPIVFAAFAAGTCPLTRRLFARLNPRVT